MHTSTKALALAAVAASLCASQALAQTAPKPKPAAAPAAAPAANNPPVQITATVPGVCVLSREGLLANSTVGAYVGDRMKQLNAVVQAEVTGDQTSLENDAKALEGQKATLQADVYQQRGQALQQRYATFQQKVQQRQRELEATQQKAFSRVLQASGPLVGQVVSQRQCGVLLDANAVIIGNPNMDITSAVITLLNGQLTQFAFDREHLDEQPGAAAPAQ
ncbi:MAG TPA: OmpH family outer membrane protein [Caulobacteraceae bacterium]|nr:OmpH family outer membrane protein [Caulobacteraceae bacterium]